MNTEDSSKRQGGVGIKLQTSQPLYNPKIQEPVKSTHTFSQETVEKVDIGNHRHHSHHSNHGNDHSYQGNNHSHLGNDRGYHGNNHIHQGNGHSHQGNDDSRQGKDHSHQGNDHIHQGNDHSHHSNPENDHIHKEHEHNNHQHNEPDCSYDNGAQGHESLSKHYHQHLEHTHVHDKHDHSQHDHNYRHVFSTVYIPPLPSWVETLSRLAPVQKTIFSWFVLHSVIGVWLYCMGTSRESLSLVGFSYLMIFDALGVLNAFVSSVLRSNQEFAIKNSKRPFGAHRYEVVFGLGTTIYLMFATMHNTKESLHHFLLEEHHKNETHDKEDHHLKLSLGMFFLIGFAITATCISSIALRNHDNFVRYLRRRPTTVHGFSYNVINRARGNPIHALLSNVYSLAIALCGSVILVSYMFGIATPFVDKFLALSESVVMFYLGFPTAKALAKVLLQTTPNSLQNGVENRLREIQQDPNIIKVERVHFWQTTYGKCVGTIEIQVAAQADEQAMLQFVYQKLQGLTSNDEELTVSIIKS